MSCHAANPAGVPTCPRAQWSRRMRGLPTRNGGGGSRLFLAGHAACSKRTAMAANFRSQCPDENFALGCVCRYVSRLLLGHRSGASPAPGGTRSSASHSAPLWGHGSSQNKFANHGKKRRANFLRAHSEKADLRPWEPGPLARLRPV